jgi:hypothetical protein
VWNNSSSRRNQFLIVKVQKRPIPVRVEFASKSGSEQTIEGPVAYSLGDALLTGVAGERWPIRRAHFETTYVALSPTKMGEDGYYLKQPLIVDAEQVIRPTVVDLDTKSGSLIARPGDWLVTAPTGRRWVVADDIFQETYISMPASSTCETS